jgi:hypothetical protein
LVCVCVCVCVLVCVAGVCAGLCVCVCVLVKGVPDGSPGADLVLLVSSEKPVVPAPSSHPPFEHTHTPRPACVAKSIQDPCTVALYVPWVFILQGLLYMVLAS